MAGSRHVRDARTTDELLIVELIDGQTVRVPLAWYPRLATATTEQRASWTIAGAGHGIHWPDIDEDLNVEALVRGAPAPVRQGN